MKDSASEIVRQATKDPIQVYRRAYMRYVGQGHEILVDVGNKAFHSSSGEELRKIFDNEYEKVYGRSLSGLADVEVASWVVTVSTLPKPDPIATHFSGQSGQDFRAASAGAVRDVFDPGRKEWISHQLHDRKELSHASEITGPAVIVEHETSTVISPGFNAKVNAFGDIEIIRR